MYFSIVYWLFTDTDRGEACQCLPDDTHPFRRKYVYEKTRCNSYASPIEFCEQINVTTYFDSNYRSFNLSIQTKGQHF